MHPPSHWSRVEYTFKNQQRQFELGQIRESVQGRRAAECSYAVAGEQF